MRQIFRLAIILRTAARYRLLELLPDPFVTRPIKLMLWLCGLGARPVDISDNQQGLQLRLALQELGPIYIKFGQLLSTRRDMLPPDIADELAKLQDSVEPFCSQMATEIVEQQLKKPVTEAFVEFEQQPLASASVAQVHAAKIRSDDPQAKDSCIDVVVKIIRPNIEKVIERDIRLLFLLARLLERYSLDARRLHLIELIEDYEQVIFAELDLKQEAANSSQLKRNFEQDEKLSQLLYVPSVYWDFCTEKMLVMERIYGTPVSDIATLNANNTDLEVLAERGVEIFFTQVFEHNFFHADMHPGNVFVETVDPENPRYIALDCAIMGTLSDADRYYTARILLGALNRDYPLVVRMYLESGWLNPDVHAPSFESLIRSVCEPVFSKPIAELEFGTLLVYLFQAARRFGMEMQPSLALLQKTLINIEGMGQQLYPQLDLWQTAQPFLSDWVEKHYSAAGAAKELQDRLPELIESIPAIPNRVAAALQKISPAINDNALQRRLHTLESEIHCQRKLNITLILIAVVWATIAFFSG